MILNSKEKKNKGPRTNESITASEVRVISSNGEQLGILSIREALNHAEDEGFDLVEVSPDYDQTNSTSTLAAQILMNTIGRILHHKKK